MNYNLQREKIKKLLESLTKDENLLKEALKVFDSVYHDIKAQERYFNLGQWALLNNSCFLWALTRDFGEEKLYYSDSIEYMTGRTCSEIDGLPLKKMSLIHKDDFMEIARQYDNFHNDSTRSRSTFYYRLVKKNGDSIWVQENVFIERDKKGEPKNFFGTVFEIDSLKEKEKRLLFENETLKRFNAAKDRFISVVSHDLRSPFTTVIGFADILLKDKDLSEETKKEYLNYIYDSSLSQLQLLNNLLDWSKLQSGKLKAKPTRLNAKTIVKEIVFLKLDQYQSKKIEIDVQIGESILIEADETLLKKALQSFIDNAIKYSYYEGLIEISAKNFSEEFIEFIIKDYGVGISEETLNQLFQYDKKISTPGVSGEKGSGFSLILSKEIIEKLGGEVWIYSELNKGAEIHFTVKEAKDIFLIASGNFEERKILKDIVKDDFKECQILEAENGYQAISLISDIVPKYIALSHEMPLMNGVELLENLREKEWAFKIKKAVIVSKLTDEIASLYQILGTDVYLERPLIKENAAKALKETFYKIIP